MKIVMGLGNPGNVYKFNRHNIGFDVVDLLADKENIIFNDQKILKSKTANLGPEIILAKSTLFMNESGQSARMLLKQYDGSLIVVHDDIDIALGEVKCSFARGSAGHNGVQSIIDYIGHNNFFRIRIGVRPVDKNLEKQIAPPHGFEKFLLSDFTILEEDKKNYAINKTLEIIKELRIASYEKIMSKYN